MWTRNRAISPDISFRNWNVEVETWYELFLGRGPQTNVNFGCGPLPACGDCQLLLGGGPHQTDTLINQSHSPLARSLFTFVYHIVFEKACVFGGSLFCQLWTWHVFFLLDLKPRTRSGYVCPKRNDFPQRRARKGEHFRARRNWCLCGPSLWDIPQNVVVW